MTRAAAECLPVGSDGERHGLRTDLEREDLAGNDPGYGTPRGGERGDVDADERNKRLLAGLVMNRDGDADDGDEVLANAHNGGTVEQERATTELLDSPHTRKGHEHVDDARRDRHEEGVLNARVLEEGRSICEQEQLAYDEQT